MDLDLKLLSEALKLSSIEFLFWRNEYYVRWPAMLHKIESPLDSALLDWPNLVKLKYYHIIKESEYPVIK